MIFVAMRTTLCLTVLALALCGGYFFASVLGDPDYQKFDEIPKTSFTCQGKSDGFYADAETGCQVFHLCANIPDADPIKNSFLCPNGTIFSQESFVCQWWPDVDCPSS